MEEPCLISPCFPSTSTTSRPDHGRSSNVFEWGPNVCMCEQMTFLLSFRLKFLNEGWSCSTHFTLSISQSLLVGFSIPRLHSAPSVKSSKSKTWESSFDSSSCNSNQGLLLSFSQISPGILTFFLLLCFCCCPNAEPHSESYKYRYWSQIAWYILQSCHSLPWAVWLWESALTSLWV